MRKKLLILLFSCVILTACGSVSSVDSSMGYDSYSTDSMNGVGFSFDTADGEYYELEDVSISSQSDSEGNLSTGVIDTEKLVYRGSIELYTLDFSSSVSKFKALVKDMGGFIENESTYDDRSYYDYYSDTERDTKYTYSSTVRIPSGKYSDFISKAGEIGEVTSQSSYVENISQRYSTAQTSLEIYQKKYDRYLKFLEDAETVDELLSIERELTSLEVNLAEYKTALSVMDTDVAYSYVNVTIQNVTRKSQMESKDTFFTRLWETYQDSLEGVLKFLEACLFWLIMNWWYIAFIIIIIKVYKVLAKKFNPKKPRLFRKKSKTKTEGKVKEDVVE